MGPRQQGESRGISEVNYTQDVSAYVVNTLHFLFDSVQK